MILLNLYISCKNGPIFATPHSKTKGVTVIALHRAMAGVPAETCLAHVSTYKEMGFSGTVNSIIYENFPQEREKR
jgi:hypothetical protein